MINVDVITKGQFLGATTQRDWVGGGIRRVSVYRTPDGELVELISKIG